VSKTQAKGGRFAALAPNQQGKTVTKRTPVDRFNDNRQSETERLTSKRKMEHDEKMASIQLKKRKYELRFRSESTPTHGSGSPRPAACAPSESEEIQVLRLKIRLAELTGGRAFLSPTQHDSLTPSTPSSPFGAAITYADSYATPAPDSYAATAAPDGYDATAPAARDGYDATGNPQASTYGTGLAGPGGSGWEHAFKFDGEDAPT